MRQEKEAQLEATRRASSEVESERSSLLREVVTLERETSASREKVDEMTKRLAELAEQHAQSEQRVEEEQSLRASMRISLLLCIVSHVCALCG